MKRARKVGSLRRRLRVPSALDAADVTENPGPRDVHSILVEDRNVWRVERAERFRCIQDGAAYFRLLREAILSAQRSVFILGWDIAAGVELAPGADDGRAPTQLAALLDHVVRQRRGLHCYVLIWSTAAIYALERDPFTKFRLGWGTHRRVHFRFDDQHPFGASHHQKVVVVDDRLAFSGGIDLTGHRWDTPEHALDAPLRTNLRGVAYAPFHDVQALVEGPAATALGELARTRWRRSGRGKVPALAPAPRSLWPADLAPDLVDVDIGIARTEPAFRGGAAVHECEALFFDAIASARRSIYIENQYFTNVRLAEALAQRLRERDGPEVVVVGPRECSGWLEQSTMGALRHAALAKLVEADVHDRLRLFHATASRARDIDTFVHAKVMIVDDGLLRIGSANLSNRSAGLDTECDLVVEVHDEDQRRAIADVRHRLIAEHVGHDVDDVRRACDDHGSLRAAIDALNDGDRVLAPINDECVVSAPLTAVVMQVADPLEPMTVTQSFDRLLPEIVATGNAPRRLALGLQVCGLLFTALAAWRVVRIEELVQAQASPVTIALAPLFFAALSLAFVPTDVLTLAAALVFGTMVGGAVALVGSALSATLGYALGRKLGARRIAAVVDVRAYTLVRELRARGATTVALLRLFPLASAMTIHLVSGAARVPGQWYALGTIAGWLPGALALLLVGGLLRRTLLDPNLVNALVTASVGFVLAWVLFRRHRTLMSHHVEAARVEQEERARFG